MKGLLRQFLLLTFAFSLAFLFINEGSALDENLLARKIDKKISIDSESTPQDNNTAGKNKGKKTNKTLVLQAVDNEGGNTVNGSVLNPKEDEINILMYSLLQAVKRGNLSDISIILTSIYNSTSTFTVPKEAISIQKKRINKKIRTYFVVNLFGLKTQSGTTIPPSALPSDTYKLRIASKGGEVETSGLNYNTPTLIVGMVSSNNPGLVSIEDLNGNIISEKTVATSSDGVFFNEVRANKITPSVKARKVSTKSQTENLEDNNNEEISPEEPSIGIVHAVTDKDLFAITSLKNDPKLNALKSEKFITVDEVSTLATNLSKEAGKDLASEVAKEQLENLEEEGIEDELIFSCNLDQLAPQCTSNDTEALSEVGSSFREVAKNTDCNKLEFGLIKEFVLALPEDLNFLIGKAYCDFFGTSADRDKPCQVYSQVLNDYKSTFITELPCPPPFCEEFKTIRPPKCVEPKRFCEEEITEDFRTTSKISLRRICRGQNCVEENIDPCIRKVEKELYCARIGTDIDFFECNEEPGWKVAYDINNDAYCIPASIVFIQELDNTVQGCKINACHKQCDKEFGFNTIASFTPISSSSTNTSGTSEKCGVCDCHLSCEVEAGRAYDCSDKISDLFSIKCCNGISSSSTLFTQLKGGGPIPNDVIGCLCSDLSNFDEKGRLIDKEASLTFCANSCPSGYELDQNSKLCFPICESGLVRDVNGFCKSKCPKGFIEGEFGNCTCPKGEVLGNSGRCETSTCPEHCKNISGHTSSNFIPVECRNCFSTTTCGSNQYIDSNGVCRCNFDGSIATSTGPEGCITRKCEAGEISSQTNCTCASPGYTTSSNSPCTCPPGYSIAYSAQGCGSTSRYCTPGESPTNSNCTCAPGAYVSSTPSYCYCPSGQTYSASGCGTTTNYCSPGILVGTNGCTCNPSGGSYNSSGYCICPAGSGTYTKETGCTSTLRPCTAGEGPSNSCYCFGGGYTGPDGKCQCSGGVTYTGAGCSTTQRYCGISEYPNTNNCVCAPGATSTTGITPCTCTDGHTHYTSTGCSTGSHTCTIGEVSNASNPCTCASGATVSANGTCQCTNGQTYTTSGCGTTTTRTCIPGEIPNTNNCVCASGATSPTGTTICTCTNGSTYTASGCSSTTQSTASLTSAVISGTNLAVIFSTNFPSDGSCAYLKDINGITLYSLFCGSTTGTTISPPISSFPHSVVVGDQVRICKSNDSAVCSPFISITSSTSTPTPTPTPTPIPQPTITLNSVVKSGGNVTLNYSTSSDICVKLYDVNSSVYSLSSHQSCGQGLISSTSTFSTSYWCCLNYGEQVKLCSVTNPSNCSNYVTVTSSTPTPTPTPTPIPQPTITLNSVVKSGGNVTLNYSTSSDICVKLYDVNSSVYSLSSHQSCGQGLISSTSTFSTSYWCCLNYGEQVKLCSVTNPSNCSNYVTVTSSTPTPTPTPTPTETIALSSVAINTGSPDTVTINFSASSLGGSNCAVLKDTAGANLHPSLALCFNNGPITYDRNTYFTSSFQSGIQVKLCNTTTNVCSQLVTVTSSAPAPTPTPAPTPIGTISLTSVSIAQNTSYSGGYAVTINFSKSFTNCVRLTTSDSTSLHAAGASVSSLCYSSTNVAITQFTSQLITGLPVKLCTLDGITCSSIVNVGGTYP